MNNIAYTYHALDRFAQRFPDCNLAEEEPTLRKPSRSQIKKFLDTAKKSGASKKSNRLPNGHYFLTSQSGCVFLCLNTEVTTSEGLPEERKPGTLVITVLNQTMPDYRNMRLQHGPCPHK